MDLYRLHDAPRPAKLAAVLFLLVLGYAYLFAFLHMLGVGLPSAFFARRAMAASGPLSPPAVTSDTTPGTDA
jgi:hypothetical protein